MIHFLFQSKTLIHSVLATLKLLHLVIFRETVPILYLLNKSFNSCSEENCPRLATNSVEHGEFDVTPLRPGELAAPFTAAGSAEPLTAVGNPLTGLVKIGVAPIVGWGKVAEIIVGWN